ncbi:MAG: alpha-(1-_3)-arabinofuranosyltransferase family protein, partial [Ilumatobacteraceae bacterium]
VSLWWIAMLLIQGKRGADVLAYSESLESVSFTSTSTEVLRGLGYWLFYIRDAFGATTTASLEYLASTRVIVFGIGLLAVVLSGLVFTTWQHRRYVALLIGAGLVLAVGVHPIDDPSPLMSVLVGDGEGGLALALRSSTRAVPVLVFGLALSAASLVAACGSIRLPTRRAWGSTWTWGAVTAIVIVLLAVGYLPSLLNGGFVDPQLERDQDPPQAWLDAAAHLDSLPTGYRVLQLPGGEFGAFRWGYTVDQPLPALTERPLLTRDLLPLGSAAAMDLVFALDDRFQDGVVDVAAIAPVARLLGVDTVWVADDVAFDRFRLARPEIVDDLLTGAGAADAGLLPPERFGGPAPNIGLIPVVDEQSVSDPRVGAPLATVSLVGIDAPVATIRAKDDVVVLSGSGDGLVDAAAAGVIDGSELILYSASLSGDALGDAVTNATRLVVTDSNRDRAHHWRGSQDVTGYTEAGDDSGVLRYESGDQRLPVFDTDDPDTQTVSIQDGPVTATASAYGEPFAYLPEHRPVMAIDGDPSTSWIVDDRGPALDESIVLDVSEPIDHVTLRQPDTVDGQRRITEVELTVDDRDPVLVVLDESSLAADGQRIDIDPTTAASRITLRITGTGTGIDVSPIGAAVGGVGFATIDVGLGPTTELIRVPIDATTAMTDANATTPLSVVFTRLRTDPTDRWRSDPEPALRRQFAVPNDAAFDTSVVVRADQRTDDAALAELLAEPVAATAHLTGVPGGRGASAVDGDVDTSWITPFGSPVGQSLHLALGGPADSVAIAQPVGTFSPITQVRISDPAGSFDLDVDQAGTDVALPRTIDLGDTTIEITAVEARTTVDRRFGEATTLPAAISEITFGGTSPGVRPAGEHVEECRDDLLQVDGAPVGLSFTASTEAILRGEPIDATLCAGDGSSVLALAAGTHTIASTPGAAAGFHVDQVVLEGPGDGAAAGATPGPTVTVTSTSRTGRTVEVSPCPEGCWVVLGEGYNEAWTASDATGSLGPPTLVDGNANGWFIAPTDEPTTITFHWTAQRTLNVALAASLLGVLAGVVLVVADRRRDGDALVPVPGPRPFPPSRWTAEAVGLPTVIVTTVASAVLIGWVWGAVALAVSLAAHALRRQRLLAAFGFLIVIVAQCAVVVGVRRDRPFPTAGFPVHFEWLHPWTLLGVVLLTCSALIPGRSSLPDRSRRSP